jgi:hypothetical protein
VPKPNFGSKSPKEEGKTCYGKDLSNSPKLQRVTLAWLLDAHKNSADKTKFFLTDSFTKHSGTEKLQQQIEAGLSEDAIKKTWQTDLDAFRKIRIKYLMYE